MEGGSGAITAAVVLFGGGGKALTDSDCFGCFGSILVRDGIVSAVFIRGGGGRSKIFLVSASDGRGGNIGFGNSCSGEVVGRWGSSGAI